MRSLMTRTPQEKRTKSRSGCKACKARRIKCDETIPSCLQCERRKVSCPGYPKNFVWSYKHQLSGHTSRVLEPRRLMNAATISTATHTDTARDSSATKLGLSQSHCLEFPANPSATEPLPVPSDQRTEISANECDLQLLPFEPFDEYRQTDAEAFAYTSWPLVPIDNYRNRRDGTSVEKDEQELSAIDSSPPTPTCDLVLCSPTIALYYFGETICARLCPCDSVHNPIRSITLAKVRDSPLFNSLLRYLTAAYLNKRIILDQTRSVLLDAQNETLHHLYNEVNASRKEQGLGTHEGAWAIKAAEEGLLALIMFGLTSSWDGTNDTGIAHYRVALSLYIQIRATMTLVNRRFYAETLAYWWTGLSFVTNVDTEPLPAPPLCRDEDSSDDYENKGHRIYPHPLTGISSRAHILLGKVAGLIYLQRSRAMKPSFLTRESVAQEERILSSSYSLEEDLLSLQVPQSIHILELDNPNTSLADLCNMAEAFRLSGLLLLYRCFPDLLRNRRADLGSQDAAEQWLCALALHILDILERNDSNSGTKSIEQIILVIVACELRSFPRHDIASFLIHHEDLASLHPACHSWSPHDSTWSNQDSSWQLLEGTGWLSDVTLLDLPSISPIVDRTEEISGDDVAQIVQQARNKICKRLAEVRSILPYKSVEQAEELIYDIWERDRNNEDAFWMDVMIQKGLKFILV